MSLTKNLRFARFVKTLLDFIYGLLIFACIALVLWVAFSSLILGQAGFLGTASVPVTLGTGDEPQFEVSFSDPSQDTIHAAFVDEAYGTLRLETNSFLLILTANAAKLVTGIGLAYVFYLLRVVVQTILDGDPFSPENAPRIRRIGYAVLALGLLQPFAGYIAAAETLKQLPPASPALNPGIPFNAEVILATLLILLLAHIWSYGLELERDQELTI
jgi:hypothetical protein